MADKVKRLYRSRREKVIGGVCGGIAEYFKIDPIIIRLIFLLLFFAQGAGILAYIIAWIIIPEKPPEESEFSRDSPESDDAEDEYIEIDLEEEGRESSWPRKDNCKSQRYLGVILIIAGALFLLDIWIPRLYFRTFWPLLLIALGIAVLVRGVGDDG